MIIDTPLHAEHQLDQLAGQFAHWRQTRPRPFAPIPSALWDQAVALAVALPPARVAHHIRVRVADLTKQMVARHVAPLARPAPTALGFVEVPPVPARPQATPTMQLELSRADGTRLSIHGAASTVPLATVLRAFLEGRCCCNSPPKAAFFSPRTPWIVAKGSMASRPCVGRCWARTRSRAPSMSAATAQARRSSCCSTTGRAIGSV